MAEIDRRDFLKLVGVSAGAAAAAGCSDHVEKLIPYVVQPEQASPGLPLYYASTCRECPAGCGLHVRTMEGRPVKLEGNPEHPINRGALCARGQAAIGRTYHPDRFQGPLRRNAAGTLEPISWEAAIELLAGEIAKAPAKTQVLGGDPGETAGKLIDRFVRAVGAGGRTIYEPFAPEALREATKNVFGVASKPWFDLAGADLVVDFGNEILDTGLSPIEHQRQLAEARDIATHPDGGARLVYVGPRLSQTASNSDEWLPARPGSEGILALALVHAAIEAGAGTEAHRELLSGMLVDADAKVAAEKTDVPAETITRLGKALAQAGKPVAIPPGVAVSTRRAIATTAAVLLLNDVIGAVGRSVMIPAEDGSRAPTSYRNVLALVKAIEDGKVDVLLIHDANPVYSLPKPVGFETALANVPFVVSFASMRDETSELAHLILPDHVPLESWGDAVPRPGVRCLNQPSIRPLYDTQALGDTLLAVAQAMGGEVATRLPVGSFRTLLEEAWSGTDLNAALARGGEFATPAPAPASLAPGAGRLEVVEPVFSGEGDFVLIPFPHSFLYDGRGANLPWLQEIPDPVVSVAWEPWAEISKATAERLGLELGEVIAIETLAGRIEVPVHPRGGIRDDVVAVPIGQGHRVGHFASRSGDGRPGEARGANVIEALATGVDESGGRAWLTERARIEKTGRFERLPLLQFSDNKRGRQLGEAIALANLAEPEHVEGDQEGHAPQGEHGEAHHESHEVREPFAPAADADVASPYRWGMTVDLDRCTGCSACVAACYVENNIPVVGEEETRRVRQMAWLRIERYIGDGDPELVFGRQHPARNREELGGVDVRHSPMMCQQCGSAPCEPVCPVYATYHNAEGLNGMVYNRCIGTRYCANNCPYKVRRFNYFDNALYKWPEPMRLGLNPDVTVRGQGVMEKCTFCVQRIQAARQTAKDEARPIRDGEVVTACQQACPTQAIQFGNLRDESSQVVQKGGDAKRSYHALHMLNTRPAVTYLAKVRREPVEG
jgi:molybdopterin-containing oxidoreductase family iron-sulfur binding subunit